MNSGGLFRGPDTKPITDLSREKFAERLGYHKRKIG